MKKLIIISAVALFVFGCSDDCPVQEQQQDPPVYYTTIKITGYLENYNTPLIAAGQGVLYYRIHPIFLGDFPPQNSVRAFAGVIGDDERFLFNDVSSGYYTLHVWFHRGHNGFRLIKQITAGSADQHHRIVFAPENASIPMVIL